MIGDDWSDVQSASLADRSSRQRARELRWVADDVLEVGATASTILSAADSTLATSIMIEDSPATATSVASATMVRVAMGYVTRRHLATVGRTRVATKAAIVQYQSFLNRLNEQKRTAASRVLRKLLVRWRAWAHAKSSMRRHEMWCAAQGRGQPVSLVLDDNDPCLQPMADSAVLRGSLGTVTQQQWQRPRGLVSWSLYSAPVSPFLPSSPMQRWLSHVHKGTSRQSRILQRFWKYARCRQFASRLWRAAYGAKCALINTVFTSRCGIAVQESRGWYDLCRSETGVEEEMARSNLARQCAVHRSHVAERAQLDATERAVRSETLLPLWTESLHAVMHAREQLLVWQEHQSRHLLAIRSIIKLDATYKEAWFQRSVHTATLWLELSGLAFEALHAGSMTLGPSDLLVSVRNACTWGRTHKRVPSSVLREIASIPDLCALVDAWALRLFHDETVAWGALNEGFGRRMLRRRLLCELPLENAMLDHERHHRAVLVRQMLKGSLSQWAAPPALRKPLTELPNQQPLLATSGEEVLTSLTTLSVAPRSGATSPLTPTGGWIDAQGRQQSNIVPTSSSTTPPARSPTQHTPPRPSTRDSAPTGRVPTAPTTLRRGQNAPPPAPRRTSVGRDGYQSGVSPALEKAMVGRKSSAWRMSTQTPTKRKTKD